MTIILSTLYVIVAMFLWTRLYTFLYRQHCEDFSNLPWGNSERAFGVFWGGFVCALWILFLPCVVILWLGVKVTAVFEPLLKKLEK